MIKELETSIIIECCDYKEAEISMKAKSTNRMIRRLANRKTDFFKVNSKKFKKKNIDWNFK